jgi:hypothetical protein
MLAQTLEEAINNNVELEAQLSQSNRRNKVTNYYCVCVSGVGAT